LWHEVTVFGLLLALAASGKSVTAAPGDDSSGHVGQVVKSPPWPVPPEGPIPPGFSWQTIHHETIHVRVLVPAGWRIEKNRDGHWFPYVRLEGEEGAVDVTFSSGTDAGERALYEKQLHYYGMPIRRATHTAETLVVDYTDDAGDRRVLGFARGLDCKGVHVRDDALANKAFRICGSLRAAPPGVWRRHPSYLVDVTTATAIPEGALVKRVGDAARIFTGPFVLEVRPSPPGGELALMWQLHKLESHEQGLGIHTLPPGHGPGFERRAYLTFQGQRYAGDVVVALSRPPWECRATFPAFAVRQPSREEIDYAAALCATLPPSLPPPPGPKRAPTGADPR